MYRWNFQTNEFQKHLTLTLTFFRSAVTISSITISNLPYVQPKNWLSKSYPYSAVQNLTKNDPYSAFLVNFPQVLRRISEFLKFPTLRVHLTFLRTLKNLPLRAARPVGHLLWVPPPLPGLFERRIQRNKENTAYLHLFILTFCFSFLNV